MESWQDLFAAVIDQIVNRWAKTSDTYAEGRQEYYFSAELLMGHILFNNLSNLGLVGEARQALAEYGQDLSLILEEGPDATLGNGDLERPAVCLLDPCAILDPPAAGYDILYHYDLFKQFFGKGFQTEHPDPWMEEGYSFIIRHGEAQRIIPYANLTARVVPYDMPITGYDTKNINTLRLWRAEPIGEPDYDAFDSQCFTETIIDRERMNNTSRVLCPSDTTFEGKVLHMRQQYFSYSAPLQTVIDNCVERHGEDLSDFAEYNAIQLSDTYPVLVIPELIRLLMDKHNLGWGDAWKIVSSTLAYTSHTVSAGAFEKWEMVIFGRFFPRIVEIVREIDRCFRTDMAERGLGQVTIDYMTPVTGSTVRMAWVVCYTSYSINGVATLHTETIKRETLKEWHELWPERFDNKTNGITPRRWLRQCNPQLVAFLGRATGSDTWVIDLSLLGFYLGAADNSIFDRLARIKHESKVDFTTWTKEREGIDTDPDAIFDVQIRRLHEYKHQLLNTPYVLSLYFRMEEDPSPDVPKRVFVFGVKIASGYIRTGGVIKLINAITELVNNDEKIAGYIRVVSIHSCSVSPVEHIVPATDVPEQTSIAGKEASGASNMKFMTNGALTLDTLGGVNAKILGAVGEDSAYTFGAIKDELPELRKNYDSRWYYKNIPGLKHVLDALVDGTLDGNGPSWFHNLCWSLLESDYEPTDVYYVLGDFAVYCEAKDCMATDHADVRVWARKIWVDIMKSGRFSSDHTIRDYAEDVWKLEATPIG